MANSESGADRDQPGSRRGQPRDPLVADAIQALRPDLVPGIPDTGSLAEDMNVFLTDLVRQRDPGTGALAAVAGEAASNAEMHEAFQRGVSRTLAERLYIILQHAVDRGELSPTADLQLLSLLPHALLQQFRLTYEGRPDPALAARIVAQFFTPGGPTPRPRETRPE